MNEDRKKLIDKIMELVALYRLTSDEDKVLSKIEMKILKTPLGSIKVNVETEEASADKIAESFGIDTAYFENAIRKAQAHMSNAQPRPELRGIFNREEPTREDRESHFRAIAEDTRTLETSLGNYITRETSATFEQALNIIRTCFRALNGFRKSEGLKGRVDFCRLVFDYCKLLDLGIHFDGLIFAVKTGCLPKNLERTLKNQNLGSKEQKLEEHKRDFKKVDVGLDGEAVVGEAVVGGIPSEDTPQTISIKDVYRAAIEKYGAKNQLEMLQEEATELALAARKLIREGSRDRRFQLASEMADVEIMMEQMFLIYGDGLAQMVKSMKMKKIKRLNKRIKK